MFLSGSDGTKSAKQNPSHEEVDAKSLLMIVVAAFGAGAFYQKKAQIIWYYQHHFSVIWTLVAVGVLAGLGFLIRRYRKKTKGFLERARRLRHIWNFESDKILAGSIYGDGTALYVPETSRTGHVQLIGATGRGKTESVIVPWVLRDFERGSSSIIMDGKGDWSLPVSLRRALGVRRDRLVVFDLSNTEQSICTNPLAQGTPQQITDRIFASFEFEDPYYRELQYSVCLDLVSVIHEVDKGNVTFRRLWQLLDCDDELTSVVAESKNEELARRLLAHLKEAKSKRDEKMSGLSSQLRPLATGELSELVNGPSSKRVYKNLSDVVLERADATIFCILLPTLLYQKAAKTLGKLFLQELAWSIGKRGAKEFTGARPFLGVFLDEFSAFAYRGFEQILNKARSANIALHLSHQSLGDLEAVGSDFATTVNTNTNVKCVLGVNDPKTADFFASHLGTSKDEKTTEQAVDEGVWMKRQTKTGAVSIREVDVFKVHPNELKEFTNGRGVLHLQTPDGPVTEIVQFSRWGGGMEGGADE